MEITGTRQPELSLSATIRFIQRSQLKPDHPEYTQLPRINPPQTWRMITLEDGKAGIDGRDYQTTGVQILGLETFWQFYQTGKCSVFAHAFALFFLRATAAGKCFSYDGKRVAKVGFVFCLPCLLPNFVGIFTMAKDESGAMVPDVTTDPGHNLIVLSMVDGSRVYLDLSPAQYFPSDRTLSRDTMPFTLHSLSQMRERYLVHKEIAIETEETLKRFVVQKIKPDGHHYFSRILELYEKGFLKPCCDPNLSADTIVKRFNVL